MAYILVIYFLTGTNPTRIDHVDSIRFDDKWACLQEASHVKTMRAAMPDKKTPFEIVCIPASAAAAEGI